MTVVSPRELGEPRATPGVRFEGVIANGRRLDPAESVRLPSRTPHHLEIAFAAVTLSDATRVRFRYRLEGFDRDWVSGDGSRRATYTNLAPGSYRFTVEASAGDGDWGEPRSLAIEIPPAFYQREAFYALLLAAVLLVGWFMWKVRVKQVRREYELVMAERFRLSRAMHDTMLQGIAALALQVDDLAHTLDPSSAGHGRAVRIRRQLERYIRQARQSIWLLRSPSWLSHDLVGALEDAVQRARYSTRADVDVAFKGPSRTVDPAVGEHLLLIAQEAIANAVKHSQAQRISVELEYAENELLLRVVDDGIGIDEAKAGEVDCHFGFTSMREHVAELGGRISIQSTPGVGTEISVIVPTARPLRHQRLGPLASRVAERAAS